MNKLQKITRNLIDSFLKVRKGDIVSIASEIYNGEDHKDPLVEISMVEAIFLELTRKKAYPLLNMSVQTIQEKIIRDFPTTVQLIPAKITRNFIENIDSFIEIGWNKLSRQILNGSDTTGSGNDPQIFYWHKIFQFNKKITFLNFPTKQLAEHINIDYDKLLNSYLESIDCDYVSLKKQAEDLKDEFFSYANYRISSTEEKLNIKIIKDSFQYFMGSPQDHQVTILPAGVIEFPVDKISLDGIFLAEKVYYKDLVFNNVKMSFSDGVIRYISFKAEDKGNYALQNKIMGSQKECYFSLGFNDRISNYTGFYLYDRCIRENICLKFFDQDSFPIVFSNINAEIKKRKRIFMNR